MEVNKRLSFQLLGIVTCSLIQFLILKFPNYQWHTFHKTNVILMTPSVKHLNILMWY